MISAYKQTLIKSLIKTDGPGKIINLARHYFTYPYSKYILTGGINIIHRCNLSCNFCIYSFNKHKATIPDMDKKTFDRCLNAKAFKYALLISLGSGETLLHKDLFKFIKGIHDKRKLVSIATNGTLIHKRIKEIRQFSPDFMWVSHYDAYEKLQVQNIKLLEAQKIKGLQFGISKLINKNNLRDMERILKLALKIGIRNVWFQQIVPRPSLGENDTNVIKQVILDTDRESLKFINKVKQLKSLKYQNINCTFPNPINTMSSKRFCYFLYKGFNIEPNGAIQPCCVMHPMGKNTYGNLFRDEMAHVYNKNYLDLKKSFLNNSKKLFPACKYCYGVNFK